MSWWGGRTILVPDKHQQPTRLRSNFEFYFNFSSKMCSKICYRFSENQIAVQPVDREVYNEDKGERKCQYVYHNLVLMLFCGWIYNYVSNTKLIHISVLWLQAAKLVLAVICNRTRRVYESPYTSKEPEH